MRVLFDENVPRKLRQHLPTHSISTVQEMGWSSLKNGQLLKMADGRFDVLLTVDKNLRYQNNLTGLRIGVLTILVRVNKLAHLIPIVELISQELERFPRLPPGTIRCVGSES